MPVTIIPDVVSEQTVHALTPADTAHAAACLMREQNVSAVVVIDAQERLVGIVTERDLTRRVVGDDRLGSDVRLREIMTPSPEVVGPHDSAFTALERMRALEVRHLPVVEDERVLAVVSMRNLQHSVSRRVVAV